MLVAKKMKDLVSTWSSESGRVRLYQARKTRNAKGEPPIITCQGGEVVSSSELPDATLVSGTRELYARSDLRQFRLQIRPLTSVLRSMPVS